SGHWMRSSTDRSLPPDRRWRSNMGTNRHLKSQLRLGNHRAHGSRGGSAGGSCRPRESGLGLRPHRRRVGQLGSSSLGPNGWQYPAPPGHRTSTQTEPNNEMEGVHPTPYGRARGNRLLHCGSTDLAGLVTYYVLFFIELESRRVWIGGITRYPDA